MAKQEFNKEMVASFKRNKAKSVFINEKGEWLFYSRKGFDEFSRAEVLGEKGEEKAVSYKSMKVDELKALCSEREIEFEEDAKKADLVSLLEAQEEENK